ncbi:hypothetical protein ABIB06_007894 [Bradyrhizobium sp. LB8.2]
MSATVVPLPPNSSSETTDFLRRMASMVSGRNGEMLLRAAALIESLAQRAMSAERLYHQEHEENTRNTKLREAGEMASDAMVKQPASSSPPTSRSIRIARRPTRTIARSPRARSASSTARRTTTIPSRAARLSSSGSRQPVAMWC